MNDKCMLIIALLFAMTSVVSAATEEKDLHTLAICFLVLCIIILIIVIIIPIVLHRRRLASVRKGYTGSTKTSRYDLSGRERQFSSKNGKDPVGFYGIYDDPQPADSIYLPLDKNNEQNGNYAHLEGSKKEDDPHTYEDLKNKSTFRSGPTYDNPAVVTDEGDDHDYELADAIVRPNGVTDYENPPDKQADTAF